VRPVQWIGLLAYCLAIAACAAGAAKTSGMVPGMRHIPAGSFLMGSINSSLEQPIHRVTLSAFYMDTTEVTQESYVKLLGVNPSNFRGDSTRPVESMTWYDAVLYCNARSRRDGLDTVYRYVSVTGKRGNGTYNLGGLVIDYSKNGYRLPTEAEWEYACRAGKSAAKGREEPTTPRTPADTAALDAHVVWSHNSKAMTAPVASRRPNAWGLYDMLGNVWEWCNDVQSAYPDSACTDPAGPGSDMTSYRILRGGSFISTTDKLRPGSRVRDDPCTANAGYGFRCVRR